MIVYSLMCDQDHDFESWFPDSAAYDKQAAKKLLSCPACGSNKIRKAPMAPRINKGGKSGDKSGDIKRLREEVEKNFEHVGERFPEEARKIHYGEAESRPIYGEASLDEARSLHEEGIAFGLLPWRRRADA